jgi:hypothetical protein
MKLYLCKHEYFYGAEKEAGRAKQLANLAQLGLEETKELHGVVCNAEDAMQLIALGYCGNYFNVDNLSVIYDQTNPALDDSIKSAVKQSVESAIESVGKLFNAKVGVEQPSANLLMVNETKVAEDACTDMLQSELHNGWRILAVCPQPQRRPDYVLGRSNVRAGGF